MPTEPEPGAAAPSDAAHLLREIERLHAMLDTNSDWIWEVDAQGRYTYASRHCLTLLGYDPSEMVGRTPFDFMPPDEAERIGLEFARIAGEKRAFAGLINRNRHRDGTIVILETSGIPLLSPAGDLIGYRGIDRDVTDRETERMRLHHIARHDDLTGLGNRLALRERLEQRLLQERPGEPVRSDGGFAVILLDLDGFKPVNDTFGHRAGDVLLIGVARRLDEATRRHRADAFRLGGDEFVVVTGDAAGDQAADLVRAVRGCFEAPFDVEGRALRISASLGTASCLLRTGSPEAILARADEALYRAKSRLGSAKSGRRSAGSR